MAIRFNAVAAASLTAVLVAGAAVSALSAPARTAPPRPQVSDHGIPLTPPGVNPGGPNNQNLGDPDYGVCRGVDPKCYHDWGLRPNANGYRALLYTRTAGPRHANLGTALGPGLNPPLNPNNVVQAGMLKLAAANGFALDYTEDVSQLGNLRRYNAVIFFSPTRDTLDDAAQTSLRQYMRTGGGFVGMHNAFGTEYNWPYYEGLLGNANYYDHGANRNGDVVITDRFDSSTKGLPARFAFRDEWYNLVPFPTKVRFLAAVDTTSFSPAPAGGRGGGAPPGAAPAGTPPGAAPPGAGRGPAPQGAPGGAPPAAGRGPVPDGAAPPAGRGGGGRGGGVDANAPGATGGGFPGHGTFHPVAWCQYYDGGRSWVTTLGHDAGVFNPDNTSFPGALEFQKLIVGGIKSAMGMEPFCQ